MYLMSTTLICAWRPLIVVTSGALRRSVPPRCSSARTTNRNCGSVRMPVTVAIAGTDPTGPELRQPDVIKLSVALAGTPAGPGTVLPGTEGPGNHPLGLAALGSP